MRLKQRSGKLAMNVMPGVAEPRYKLAVWICCGEHSMS